ncbi:putative metallopeptidase [Chelativorans salis]|uniref:Putative phage metallopeptidase domain-containing protein n=1 Tax=Chelativorans salis TaxID=2978478 RepID=A0ABT2LRI3_9HYPH|nr:putative metallopeptidase [Chelativorans sp. EGI FJ00035]MCT7377153.1 hypothetical protein [Chelativorans sp. EGI FJ00035]
MPDLPAAHELIEWITSTIIEDDAPLHNPDHAHLAGASIGALWTNVDNAEAGRQIVGRCELRHGQLGESEG